MWSYSLLCFLTVTAFTSVNCQLDADQVYKLLSSRINVENDLMRKDLKKLEEKIDLKDSNLNKKIDSISMRISLLEKGQGMATEELQQDMEINNSDYTQAKSRGINFDSIENQLTIFRQALNSEKQYVRDMVSAIVNKTDSLTENVNAVNDKIEKTGIELNELNETTIQAFMEEKQNLRLLESSFVHQFDSLSEKQNITMDIIERNEEEMQQINETIIIDHSTFNQQFKKINQTQDIVESQMKTMSQKQQSLDSTIQNNKRSLNQVVNKQQSQDSAIQNNQRSLNQVVNKQQSLDSAIQNNQRSLNQVVNKQSSLDSAIQSNQRSLNRISNTMEERKVAFHTDLHTTRKFSVGSKIIFDFIIFQEGSGYNRHTGVFTCPVSGVYMFSVVLANENSAHTELMAILKADSVTKINILSEKHHSNQNDQGSSLAVVKLYKGDKVWVEIWKKSALVQRYRSTFSGALLYVD